MQKKKVRKKQEHVATTYRTPITQSEWRKIFSLQWTESTLIIIAYLFIGRGHCNAELACQGKWSRVMQANRLFIKYGLPYRIKSHPLPDHQLPNPPTKYEISKLAVLLETVIKTN